MRNKKVRGSYSNGNFFKLSCSSALNGSPHSKKEKRRLFSPHSPTQQGREAWGRGYNRQDIIELKYQTFLIHEWHGWPFRTGSATRFACQMQIIKQNNVKPPRTPRDNSVENRFQRFALTFVSFLRRKHDFRRGIYTFVWRILFEEPRIWTSGLNLRTRVFKSVTAAQERLDMRRGCHAAKILPVASVLPRTSRVLRFPIETPRSGNKATQDWFWMQAINEQYWQWNLALRVQ